VTDIHKIKISIFWAERVWDGKERGGVRRQSSITEAGEKKKKNSGRPRVFSTPVPALIM
jgi:hypothetical protein